MSVDYLPYICPEIQVSLDEHTLFFLVRQLNLGDYERSIHTVSLGPKETNGWVGCDVESMEERVTSESLEWKMICNIKGSGSLIEYPVDRNRNKLPMYDPIHKLINILYKMDGWHWKCTDDVLYCGVNYLKHSFRNEGYWFHKYSFKSWWMTYDRVQCFQHRKLYPELEYLHRCQDPEPILTAVKPQLLNLHNKNIGIYNKENIGIYNKKNIGIYNKENIGIDKKVNIIHDQENMGIYTKENRGIDNNESNNKSVRNDKLESKELNDMCLFGDSEPIALHQLYTWGLCYCHRMGIKCTVVIEGMIEATKYISEQLVHGSTHMEVNTHLLFCAAMYLFIAVDCTRNEWTQKKANSLRAASAACDTNMLFQVCIRLLMKQQCNLYNERRSMMSIVKQKGYGALLLSKSHIQSITVQGSRNVSWNLPFDIVLIKYFSRLLNGPSIHITCLWHSYKYYLIRILETSKTIGVQYRRVYINDCLESIHKGAMVIHNVNIYLRAVFLVLLNTSSYKLNNINNPRDGSLSLLLILRSTIVNLFIDAMGVAPTRYIIPTRLLLACVCISLYIIDRMDRNEYIYSYRETSNLGKSLIYIIVDDTMKQIQQRRPVICSCTIPLCLHRLCNIFEKKNNDVHISHRDVYGDMFQSHRGFSLICSLLGDVNWTIEIAPICSMIARLHREGSIRHIYSGDKETYQGKVYRRRFELLQDEHFENQIIK